MTPAAGDSQKPELDRYGELISRARCAASVSRLSTEELYRIHALLEELLSADTYGGRQLAALEELERTLDSAGGSRRR